MMADDGFVETEVVYLGQRPAKAGGSTALYITVALLNRTAKAVTDNAAGCFDGKKGGGRIVGGVYSGPCKVDGDGVSSIRMQELKFVRRIESAETAEWEMLDQACRDNLRAVSQERKIKADKVAHDEFRTLRRMYAMSSSSMRPAFELAVLKMLRGAA
jgi:hypothetical protein